MGKKDDNNGNGNGNGDPEKDDVTEEQRQAWENYQQALRNKQNNPKNN